MIKKYSELDFRKQPKWVRDHINSLYQEIDELQDRITEVTGSGEEASDVTWYIGDSYERSLPSYSRVSFNFAKDKEILHDIRINKLEVNGKTVVRVEADCAIHILPSAGNAVNIMMED
jgi:flagellar hook-associated protein FlgK